MSYRARSSLIRSVRRPALSIVATAFALLAWALTRTVGAQTLPAQVAQYTFEDGTADGWSAFYDASAPTYSTAATAAADPDGGKGSLLTTVNYTSTGGGGGPALQLTALNLVPGATYSITGYVMLTAGEAPSDANFTVQRIDSGCSSASPCYDTVGGSSAYQTPVTATSWTKIGGTYTVSTSATSLILYAQLSPSTAPTAPQSFYLDDVTLTEVAGPPNSGQQDNSGITTNFEDGGLDGWMARGPSTVVTNVPISNGPSGETRGLYVTGRTAAWNGAQISVEDKMYVGSQYAISLWVMSPSGDTLNLSLQTTLTASGTAATSYPSIATVQAPAGQWVQISVPRYTMANAYDPAAGSAYLYVQSNYTETGAAAEQPFYIADFQLQYLPPLVIQQNIPSIYQTLARYFPVGAEIDSSDLIGPHAQLLTKHFDSIVSGNDMKWQFTEPTEGNFTFATADAEVKFAEQHNMLVRGHNLVWANGSETPSWVFLEEDGKTPLSASNPADVQLLTQRIQNHIKALVQHFGTAVYVWDVVNEPLDPSQPDCLQHGPFYKVLGPRYIEIALEAAREYAPPGTQLFINEYGLASKSRLQCMIRLIRDLRRHDVPLDGIGHEMHAHIDYPPPSAEYHSFEVLHRLFPRLKQQVTELDVSVYASNDNTSNYGANGGSVPAALLAEQGWLYKGYFDVFKALARRHALEAVTLWGMADDNTWLDSFPINRLDAPLPFDQLLQAKPAYWGIVDPTQLPGYGLTLALTGQSGSKRSGETWTITATNPGEGTAYGVQIDGLALRQVAGRPCRVSITPPSSYPVVLGDVAGGGMASASFTVQFHCGERRRRGRDFAGRGHDDRGHDDRGDREGDDAPRFILRAPWSANVYETGTLVQKDVQP
ncbi:MAG: endo-1,4-beta-xylanase [Pseudomonadota bacterium]|jgi:endo-1,4-beta-xylanase|nr:endo-1,4-beta-xylanase [Pseudomonadota bacterium]